MACSNSSLLGKCGQDKCPAQVKCSHKKALPELISNYCTHSRCCYSHFRISCSSKHIFKNWVSLTVSWSPHNNKLQCRQAAGPCTRTAYRSYLRSHIPATSTVFGDAVSSDMRPPSCCIGRIASSHGFDPGKNSDRPDRSWIRAHSIRTVTDWKKP